LRLRLEEKIFYGWVMVVTCLIVASTLWGIRFSFGVFFKSLESEFVLNRATTSSLFSAYMLFCAIFAVLGGWAVDRYGPRIIVLLLGLFTGFSLLLASQTNSLWQLFLSYSLLLGIGTGPSYTALLSTVSRWFEKKRGFALGIVFSGVALGTIVVSPFAAYLISNLGWRMSYIVLGLAAWFVVISLSRLLRRDPSEVGALPDGAKLETSGTGAEGKEENPKSTGFSLLQAFRTRSFWLLFVVWVFLAFCQTLMLTHIVPHATDMGIATMKAATVLSITGGFNILSSLLTGRVSDIVGRKIPGIVCSLLLAVALVGLIWAGELWMLYLVAVVFGLAWGGLGVIATALSADIFGGRNLGVIMGTLNMAWCIGAAIGPFVGGLVFDVSSSYSMAFAIGAAIMLVTALLVTLTRWEATAEIE